MREKIKLEVLHAVESLYKTEIKPNIVQIQNTRKEFDGDFTVVVFPLVKYSRRKPEDTANDIAVFLKRQIPEISSYNVIKGFLNLSMVNEFWLDELNRRAVSDWSSLRLDAPQRIMIEYSSPNTNKPLHLGHIRNNLLGDAISRILKANGHEVIRVNLINDRGIHICKSMQAYLQFAEGETPDSKGMKGDKFVGDLYVKFENALREEIARLTASGMSLKEARDKAPIIQEAKKLLKKWESGDTKTIALWEKMNAWVYKGFDKTYRRMGIAFDQVYYESNTFKIGKQEVLKGLDKGVFEKKDDGSVWIDLTGHNMDEKLVLRADGTSVYITQDIGTAVNRFEEFKLDEHIYVVGSEQNYHFQVLKLILKQLGYAWSDQINHLSYGMVELPEGKMKSREGKVVDADDLMDEMLDTSRSISDEQGKLAELSGQDKEKVFEMISLGALKYFILKVDPQKTMLFNPRESIDFNGNTGPFIQYTHARIRSVIRKARGKGIDIPERVDDDLKINDQEASLIKLLMNYSFVLPEAGRLLDPGIIANYVFDLAKEYNHYYHYFSILKAEDSKTLQFRLLLSDQVAITLEAGMALLGIEVPERM